MGKNICNYFSSHAKFVVHGVGFKRPKTSDLKCDYFHKADLTSMQDVKDLFKKVFDIVIQAAATTSDPRILLKDLICM